MPRQSRYENRPDRQRDPEAYGSRQRQFPYESRAGNPDEPYDPYDQDDADRRDFRFEDRDTSFARQAPDHPARYREEGRYRDRADRAQSRYDADYQGRSPRSDWDGRGSDGVVLPAGPSAYGRERQGQDQMHRGKGPKDYQRSDDRIREDVCDRLSEDGGLDASDITVRVEQGEVTLDGTVGSRREKRAAEDCVDSVSGVAHCQNNLRVSQMARGSQSATETSERSGSAEPASNRKQKPA